MNNVFYYMKLIIVFFLLIFLCLVGFSQNHSDTINFNNINLELINSLVINKVKHIRDSLLLTKFIYDESLSKVTRFQNTYITNFDILTHNNPLKINNKDLTNLEKRINFFNPEKKYELSVEISNYYPFYELEKVTYDYVSSMIVGSYLHSKSHRMAIIMNVNSLKYIFNFKTNINNKTKKIYNTGVIMVISH